MTDVTETTKTQAPYLQVGDVIRFDLHKGVLPTYTGQASETLEELLNQERPEGRLTITAIEVESVNAYSMRKSSARQYLLTFDNGRTIPARSAQKFPVES